MLQKLLVVLNDTTIDGHIFDQALSLATANNAELILLQVLSPFDERYKNPPRQQKDGTYTISQTRDLDYFLGYWELLKQKGVELLTSLTNKAIAKGIKAEFIQEIGDFCPQVCQVAQIWKADLIIIGRHGLSGVSPFLLGSVSNYLLHHTTCSVLTVQDTTPQVASVSLSSQ
ncbi:universal stress protein [Cylindrospermum sp. FACHB-282]|uniref:universal stress protein n=1 Tax=Cylindrospermum sp. FACHB-282 TaxID=2692794 RepID=UPI0016873E81|nr:universal stress protein [Cylindrospermum sp. FACHB-282]MBD2386078.1 universal stress protein [Cylindrospermum sp. FACHB-282]